MRMRGIEDVHEKQRVRLAAAFASCDMTTPAGLRRGERTFRRALECIGTTIRREAAAAARAEVRAELGAVRDQVRAMPLDELVRTRLLAGRDAYLSDAEYKVARILDKVYRERTEPVFALPKSRREVVTFAERAFRVTEVVLAQAGAVQTAPSSRVDVTHAARDMAQSEAARVSSRWLVGGGHAYRVYASSPRVANAAMVAVGLAPSGLTANERAIKAMLARAAGTTRELGELRIVGKHDDGDLVRFEGSEEFESGNGRGRRVALDGAIVAAILRILWAAEDGRPSTKYALPPGVEWRGFSKALEPVVGFRDGRPVAFVMPRYT